MVSCIPKICHIPISGGSRDSNFIEGIYVFIAGKGKSKINEHGVQLVVIFQTEAERRRRETGVKQSMQIRVGSCTYVCMFVCKVFYIIS